MHSISVKFGYMLSNLIKVYKTCKSHVFFPLTSPYEIKYKLYQKMRNLYHARCSYVVFVVANFNILVDNVSFV